MEEVLSTSISAEGAREEGVGRILIEEDVLQARVRELGAEISRDYAGRDLLLVGVLKGAVFFMADLMRELTIPCEIDFMAISSYGAGTDSSGVVRILKDLDLNISGRNVLVVEDIIDSGLTLSYLVRSLTARKPASVDICALLTKPALKLWNSATADRRASTIAASRGHSIDRPIQKQANPAGTGEGAKGAATARQDLQEQEGREPQAGQGKTSPGI